MPVKRTITALPSQMISADQKADDLQRLQKEKPKDLEHAMFQNIAQVLESLCESDEEKQKALETWLTEKDEDS